uniref:Troponin I type 2a (skeletal, fast), tandem duplicate 3 n=1 Tax=Astyanax mexicanus TaxID=7994 RepID=A0A3B1JC75_ASTMX
FCRKKMTSSRRHHLKSLMLGIAKGLLEKEAAQLEVDRAAYMAENCPDLSMPGSTQELQELCKKLHSNIDKVDEERYDLEAKVAKSDKEVFGFCVYFFGVFPLLFWDPKLQLCVCVCRLRI